MAIVKNWTEPLEDALRINLKADDLSPEDLEKIQKAVDLLEGTELSDEIKNCLKKNGLDWTTNMKML